MMEDSVKISSKILFGAILGVAMTMPALADTAINSVVVHSMDGKTTLVPITAERQAELIASPHAHPLAAGIVVLVADGKTYVIDDHKMPDGRDMIKTVLGEFVPQGGG
jgi:hypothetical protein